VDAHGWQFAVHAHSAKGRQLTERPRAALTFCWPLLGRQVRVRGMAEPASPEESAADLLARAPSARAEVLLGRQSEHLESPEERDRSFRTALARIDSAPALVSPEWTLYTLVSTAVEFWQADEGRGIGGHGAQRVQCRAQPQVGLVADAGGIPVPAGDPGPFLADVTAGQPPARCQAPDDCQGGASGEGTDLQRGPGSHPFGQQGQERAFVR
jgi:hypothetical protein